MFNRKPTIKIEIPQEVKNAIKHVSIKTKWTPYPAPPDTPPHKIIPKKYVNLKDGWRVECRYHGRDHNYTILKHDIIIKEIKTYDDWSCWEFIVAMIFAILALIFIPVIFVICFIAYFIIKGYIGYRQENQEG